ncbi:hypothetical protein BX616_006757 [Lobosporangium transversale]|uniref:GST N-terminal domain-containing protein n=1 Tax=Lobosporangium transversale TaxID=64571 RepID=A0A1Y2GUZ9_9FUNG|nr:hypothetical protein BCR41DRAFT_420135 [Lobosporangium transversale]KAF9918674.1 hypothetical protein BX616_006757 [Lobosporangium transversale]ORZ24884.1 hypothetical protein BCR41DRAFT_420135 [Lobosporangium transversale]|eukprot:XP_021883865.1 hypothetical protein BCR41DRAFT_420135 [Lobosporangium transversale]
MPFLEPNDNSTYVVKYMNLMGRAGVIRVLLHLAGANYKNEFITMDQVAADKSAFPFGHLPVLVEHRTDGTTFELAESLAIEHYLAEKFGLLGSTPQEAATYKSVAFNIYMELYVYCFASSIPIHEQIADSASEFNVKALPNFLSSHERWLNKNGNNGHYFGNTLSYPDLVMLNWVRLLSMFGIKLDEKSPIRKLEQTIKALPQWKGQYEKFHPTSTIEP